MTSHQKLECDTVDQNVSLPPPDSASVYTLYAFKITDGPIGPGTHSPRSKSATVVARHKVTFAAKVNKNLKVILYYQMLKKIEFHKFHAILVL